MKEIWEDVKGYEGRLQRSNLGNFRDVPTPETEIWLDIKGYEGHYQMSTLGRLKSIKFGKEIIKKLRRVPVKKRDGTITSYYLQAQLCKDGVSEYLYAHQLVAQAFIPNPEGKPQVNHIDGNKENNVVTNLEWNTIQENVDHSRETGLNTHKGENHALSKLTEKDVLEIRERYRKGKGKGVTQRKLADEYGVTDAQINRIIKRITWTHI